MSKLKNDLLLILAQNDLDFFIIREILEKIYFYLRNKLEFGSNDYRELQNSYHKFYEILATYNKEITLDK